MTLTSLWTMNVYNCLNYCFLCIFFRPGLTLHYSSFILSHHAVCPLFSLAFSHVWHPLYLHSSVHLFTLALALSEPLPMTSTPWVIGVSALGDSGVGKQLWPFRWVLCGCSCSLAEWQLSSSPSNFNCFVGKLRLPFQWYWPNARGTIPTVLPTLNRGLSPQILAGKTIVLKLLASSVKLASAKSYWGWSYCRIHAMSVWLVIVWYMFASQGGQTRIYQLWLWMIKFPYKLESFDSWFNIWFDNSRGLLRLQPPTEPNMSHM